MNDDNNVYRFGAIQGGKPEATESEFPSYPYSIRDVEDEEHYAEGYLIFTSHHVCIMEDTPKGPVTAFMIPIHRVKDVALVIDEEDETAH